MFLPAEMRSSVSVILRIDNSDTAESISLQDMNRQFVSIFLAKAWWAVRKTGGSESASLQMNPLATESPGPMKVLYARYSSRKREFLKGSCLLLVQEPTSRKIDASDIQSKILFCLTIAPLNCCGRWQITYSEYSVASGL